MYEIRQRFAHARKDERGYTLQEVLPVVAIAAVICLALPKRWKVDAATKQLVGYLRLTHGSATNQLTNRRVVLALDRAEAEEGPDCYLARLAEPCGPGCAGPSADQRLSHAHLRAAATSDSNKRELCQPPER